MKKTRDIVGGYTAELGNANVKKVVPLLSMRTMLQSLPRHLPIWFLKTDMQGAPARAPKQRVTSSGI